MNKSPIFIPVFPWNSEVISPYVADILMINIRTYPATGVKLEPLKFGICPSSFFFMEQLNTIFQKLY